MTEHHHVFLSYSRNDPAAAANLRAQLERRRLSVFKDDESIRAGDLWLGRLQGAVDGCGAFVVLVGRDGVRRWIGAETQVALNRYFAPHDDAERLPIFPILLDGSEPETLPAFLRLFQMTPWNGADELPERLLGDIRERKIVADDAVAFEGCPFVGLAAYRPDQAQLFFGRQKETLDALACFDARLGFPAVRWLEINGNSGSGKSSLMNAGLLPLIDQGWLWPRTGYERWRRIGPMMPGERPVEMLAEHLARTFGAKMGDVCKDLQDDDLALRYWLRERKDDETAFLLAIDQFEELFTFADADERRRFDRLLAAALEDPECPLFVISTVRADFLDRFGEDLPRLVAVRNRLARPWTLAPIDTDGLREVIGGAARLAGLDVGQVQEAMVAEARDEPGALPLVENALHWLWEKRTGNRLSGQLFNDQGGLAGILSRGADDLLAGFEEPERDRAIELLFQLVRVDREGSRHARQRIGLEQAIAVAGGDEAGRAVVNRLSGQRRPDGGRREAPLRLITVTEEGSVSLIHETLIRSKGLDAAGKPQPYWPMLWTYIEQHMDRAVWLERLRADTRTWLERERNPGFQWSHERVREAAAALTRVGPKFEPSPEEDAFLGPVDFGSMLAELERPQTTHRRRELLGDRLDMLGDPRSGVGIDAEGTPEIDWCRIKGGEVTIAIRSDPNNRYSDVVDTITHTVEPFQIARYPITAAQYRAFVKAEDGWRNPQWWADDLYRDPDKLGLFSGARFGNCPASAVNWFEAMAYCRWLSRRLSLTIRLPDEWEWQQAATGGNDENAFPWGADWDADQEPYRANTFEGRLGEMTAVGMYPAGASPQGVLDLAGTVWEWCRNKFDKPEMNLSGADDFAPRVLRGGSWDVGQGSARSAGRNGGAPNFRDDDIGFRVLCSSPIFAH